MRTKTPQPLPRPFENIPFSELLTKDEVLEEAIKACDRHKVRLRQPFNYISDSLGLGIDYDGAIFITNGIYSLVSIMINGEECVGMAKRSPRDRRNLPKVAASICFYRAVSDYLAKTRKENE